jgi:hypothetical protein
MSPLYCAQLNTFLWQLLFTFCFYFNGLEHINLKNINLGIFFLIEKKEQFENFKKAHFYLKLFEECEEVDSNVHIACPPLY